MNTPSRSESWSPFARVHGTGTFMPAAGHRPQSPANAINRPQTSAPSQQTVERMA